MFIFKKLFASFLVFFLMIGVGGTSVTHGELDKANCKLDFTVMSDAHMEGNNKETRNRFIKAMYDVKNNTDGSDALVFTGDNTMNGQDIENMFFYGLLAKINPCSKVFVGLGNHDTGNGIDDYDKRVSRYFEYYNGFYGDNISTPYYAKSVNGYAFLFLGSESDAVNSCEMSEAQLQWLDGQLKANAKDGKPVFVFNHHPYYAIDNNMSGKLVEVLSSYDNVFYISGHMHTSQAVVNSSNGFEYVNLPKCTDEGFGMQVEVYENSVVLRVRNYLTSEWVQDYTVNLK